MWHGTLRNYPWLQCLLCMKSHCKRGHNNLFGMLLTVAQKLPAIFMTCPVVVLLKHNFHIVPHAQVPVALPNTRVHSEFTASSPSSPSSQRVHSEFTASSQPEIIMAAGGKAGVMPEWVVLTKPACLFSKQCVELLRKLHLPFEERPGARLEQPAKGVQGRQVHRRLDAAAREADGAAADGEPGALLALPAAVPGPVGDVQAGGGLLLDGGGDQLLARPRRLEEPHGRRAPLRQPRLFQQRIQLKPSNKKIKVFQTRSSEQSQNF